MSRRRNGEGTYGRRADGRHVYKLRCDGTRHEFTGRSKAEAYRKMVDFQNRSAAFVGGIDESYPAAWKVGVGPIEKLVLLGLEMLNEMEDSILDLPMVELVTGCKSSQVLDAIASLRKHELLKLDGTGDVSSATTFTLTLSHKLVVVHA